MSDTGALIVGRTISSSPTRIESLSSSRENSSSKPATTSFLSSISPGKTIAGLLGAVITGPISAVIYSSLLLPSSSSLILKDVYNKQQQQQQQQQCDGNGVVSSSFTSLRCFIILSNYPMIRQLILGLVLSMAGIIGDLAESSVKRLSMKKDSGKLLPGHGGVVDRFDSLFVSAVVYYYWMLV
jgi:phosphatidate cytidylyltransferase